MKKYIKPVMLKAGNGNAHIVSKGCPKAFNVDCGILARM